MGNGIVVTATGLTLSGAKAGDYVLSSATAAGNIGRINAATLTYVASAAATRTYGSANPTFAGSVTGFVGGDTLISATTGTLCLYQLGGGDDRSRHHGDRRGGAGGE